MTKDSGVAHLIPIIIVLLLIVGIFYLLVTKDVIKTPFTSNKEAAIELKKDYQNPFDKKTQYVNPFSSYKNPFDLIE